MITTASARPAAAARRNRLSTILLFLYVTLLVGLNQRLAFDGS